MERRGNPPKNVYTCKFTDFNTSNFFLYASAQNIFDVPETLLRFGSQTPGYARGYQVLTTGVQLTLGVKGTF